MKKILLFLLPFFAMAQNPTNFPYGIKNTVAPTVTTPTYFVTHEANGIHNKTASALIAKITDLDKKQSLSTGLIKNGAISINADPTKYNISAGIGVITNYDNPEIPTCTIVNFAATTGKTPTYLTSGNITYVAINSSGVIVEQATQFTTSQRRDLIILGAVIHSNLTTINVVNNISAPTNSDTNQLHDLMSYIGALNLTGNKYTANGANMSLDKSAGSIFKAGANFATDWKRPHELDQALQTLLTFRYRTQNGTEGSDVTVLNPAVYDLSNVLTAVPSNKFTIQTVTMFQTGLTRIQYGQSYYNTLEEAQNAILTRAFVVESNIAMNGVTRAYIVMRNTTTSLQNTSDAKIIEAQKFGGVASGGVALTDTAIIAALGYTPENVANKNIINGYVGLNTNGKILTSYLNNSDGNLGQVLSDNLIDKTTFTAGFLVDSSTGTLTANAAYSSTDIMQVFPNLKYKYLQKTGGVGVISGAWYDIGGVFISGFYVVGSETILVAPSNAYKIRVSYSNATPLNNFYFFRALKFSSYGDSITEQNQWQPLLSKYLGLFSKVVGFGGYTIGGNLSSSLNNTTNINALDTDSDIVTILGGTNDWAQNYPIGTENSTDLANFYGGYNSTVAKIKARCPNAIIVILATTYGEYAGRVGFSVPKGELNALGLSTNDYANAAIIVAKNHNVKFIRTDNLWNTYNVSVFMNSSVYIHPNSTGGALMASKISLDLSQTVLDFKIKDLDLNSLHKNNNETFSGVKQSSNSGTTQTNGLYLTNNGTGSSFSFGLNNISSGIGQSALNTSTGTGIRSENTSTGTGIRSENTSTGIGMYANNTSTSIGFYANNASTGIGIYSNNTSSGTGIRSNGSTASTGFVYLGQNNNSTTFSVNKEGDIVSNSLKLSTTPTTSAGTYDVLTRNTSTGIVEKKLNSDFLHTTGDETKTGNLTMINPIGGGSKIILTNNNTSSDASLTASSTTTASVAIQTVNSSNGIGFLANNTGAGVSLKLENISTGKNVVLNNSTAATGVPFTIQKNSVDKLTMTDDGGIQSGAPIRLKNYTVATLPTGVQGDTAYVTDALTPTYLGVLVGGGAVVTPVFYNGTAWVSH